MLWIWQLSHLGDSKARLFSLISKARLVMSHFLLVLPVTGFAPNSSTAIHHRRNGCGLCGRRFQPWNSSCCSVCCRSSGGIERTLDKQEKKVPKLIFWPLIILKSEWLWFLMTLQCREHGPLHMRSILSTGKHFLYRSMLHKIMLLNMLYRRG